LNKIIDFAWKIWNQWLKYRYVDPIVSFARLLIIIGAGLMTPGGVWWLVVAFEIKPEIIPGTYKINIGPETVTIIGSILLFAGLCIGILGIWRIKKVRSSCFIYLRGLSGMNDSPPIKDLPPKYRYGEVAHLTMDTHNEKAEKVLPYIDLFKKMFDGKVVSMNLDAPTIVFAGLAQVPVLYIAGLKLSTRDNIFLMDYNRFDRSWHTLDAIDDHERLEIIYPTEKVNDDVALALPFTVDIAESQIPKHLRDRTIWMKLNSKGSRTDSLSSNEKLDAILTLINNEIRNLRGKKGYESIKTLHLFIAAQASTVFKLGALFQQNIYPNLKIYHFQGSKGIYSWYYSIEGSKIKYQKLD